MFGGSADLSEKGTAVIWGNSGGGGVGAMDERDGKTYSLETDFTYGQVHDRVYGHPVFGDAKTGFSHNADNLHYISALSKEQLKRVVFDDLDAITKVEDQSSYFSSAGLESRQVALVKNLAGKLTAEDEQPTGAQTTTTNTYYANRGVIYYDLSKYYFKA
jgi:hypothetical protein